MDYKQSQISTEDEIVGTYGTAWIEWMEIHHEELVREMKRKNTFLEVARSVDDTAWEYRNLLDRQYEEQHPRPETFEEIVRWERTREYYTDSTVMRESVLIPITTP